MAKDEHERMDISLKCAVENGEITKVKKLIRKGANIHIDDDYCICCAAFHGYSKLVEILIQNGADVHAQDSYPIWIAISHENAETIKIILDNVDITDKEFEQILVYAVISNRLRVTQELLRFKKISRRLWERILDISISAREAEMAVLIVKMSENVTNSAVYAIDMAKRYGANMKFMAPLFQLIR